MPWRIPTNEQEHRNQTKKQKAQRAYEVWVSEVMAQQTQAATVIPYYQKWLQKWPTVNDLAKASEDEVRAAWSGLGYYSRATRLLTGAQKVIRDFDGMLPSDPKVLEKQVDGIGPYTAGAIASIAYNKRVPAVDGNVQRVYSRLFAIHANAQAKATVNHLQALAQDMLPAQRPGDFNVCAFISCICSD